MFFCILRVLGNCVYQKKAVPLQRISCWKKITFINYNKNSIFMRTIFSIKSLLIAVVVVVLGSCTEVGGLINEDLTKGSLGSRAMNMRGHDVAYCD